MQTALYSDSSSNEEMPGAGRLQSEEKMQKKTKTKHLVDAEGDVNMDLDEAMESVDREKQLLDSADNDFLSSVDLSMHEKTKEKAEIRSYKAHKDDYSYINPDDSPIKPIRSKHRSAMNLIGKSQEVVRTSSSAHKAAAVSRARARENWLAHKRAMERDRGEVKEVLAAGEKVAGAEVDGYEADDEWLLVERVGGVSLGEEERSGRQGGVGGVVSSLTRLEKGIKKISKALE